MRMVLNEPLPVEVDDLLARRRALGQDTFDEVWNGEYHMNPGPGAAHGRLDAQLHEVLNHRARAIGLYPISQFNIGTHDNYRVPDGGYLRQPYDGKWVPDAAIVVEVLSPYDETFEKFDHFAEHGVVEIIVVDPERHHVTIYGLDELASRFDDVGRSPLLGITATELTDELEWP